MVLIPKTPQNSGLFFPSWVWSFQLLEMGLETGNLVPEPSAWTPPQNSNVMSGQAGEEVVLGHDKEEDKEDGAWHSQTPQGSHCPAPLYCFLPSPSARDCRRGAWHCQPSPIPYPWAIPAPSMAGHSGTQAPESKKPRLASISVFTSHSTSHLLPMSHQHYRHPLQVPPAVRHFWKQVEHFSQLQPPSLGVCARSLSAVSPAPRQKWGEWQRCCPGQPWWRPF